jgi:putative membrane protein
MNNTEFAPELPSTPLPESRISTFWRHAFAIQGSITPHIMPNVCIVGALAIAICIIANVVQNFYGIKLGLPIGPYEFTGTALGLLLVLRTNAGYDRWWEARKLWGGIVNQCRNLAISGISYGPQNRQWQTEFIRWIAAFAHASRISLRGQRECAQIVSLVGEPEATKLTRAQHMPTAVVLKLSRLMNEARANDELDGFAFMQLDRERAQLIDHIGACERIMKTPLALAYSIKIRRFIIIFLFTLPFGLIHELGSSWLVPFLTMLVAYPLFSLDQIGSELQNPFDLRNLSHLPLDEISDTITSNVLALEETPVSLEKTYV